MEGTALSRDQIREHFVAAAKRLGDDLRYACIFGSAAYEMPKDTDVDVAFFIDEPLAEPVREQLVSDYLALHEQADLPADHDFPGEYVPYRELRDAIEGKGFRYDRGVRIDEICRDEWTPFNSHRHHLSVVAGPTDFVYGSPRKLRRDKFDALWTLVGVLVLNRDASNFERTDLVDWAIDGGKTYLGFKNDDSVRTYLDEHVRLVLQQMVDEGTLQFDGRRYSVVDPGPFKTLESQIRAFQARADQ